MNRAQAPRPDHELSVWGVAPWPVPLSFSMGELEANPAGRCCEECGRKLLLLLLDSTFWVSHRTEQVTFRDDLSVMRRVTVEFQLPEQAPLFRADAGQTYRLLPLSVMRRKTLLHFELRDDDGKSVFAPSLRQSQTITESMLLACADAILEQTGSKTSAATASHLTVCRP